MSTSRDVAELLAELAVAMRASGLPWYLFGAQAAIVWGSPRLSADVDVTAAVAELDTFIENMRKHGFDIGTADRDSIERHRVVPFVHRGSRILLDVVLAGPGLEEEFLRRAIAVDVDGTSIPVISPEDLLVTKILAGRAKDLEDVRGVLAERRSSLDIERIRAVLGLLEQALTRSDLLSVFDKEWERMK